MNDVRVHQKRQRTAAVQDASRLRKRWNLAAAFGLRLSAGAFPDGIFKLAPLAIFLFVASQFIGGNIFAQTNTANVPATNQPTRVDTKAAWEIKPDLTNVVALLQQADYYSQHGQPRRALEDRARAAELKPTEAEYHRDLARAIILFREDAKVFYNTNEQGILAKALDSYQQAMRCDPTNYALAVEAARAYYSVAPFRTDAALAAWTNALHLAHTELEDENVYLNTARINANAHRFDEAHKLLNLVTNEANEELQGRVAHVLRTQEIRATNGVAGGQK